MTTKNLKIHTENLLPIIKKWLYSDKEIFVRELVSNACDAIQKCTVLASHGECTAPQESFRIDIAVDKDAKTLTFTDNGIGMTAEEVEKYIAQIAFSGAEEFLQAYKGQDQIIGHFGLGFFSAYMVAKQVTLDTRSYKEGEEPAFWSCEGTSTYELAPGSRTERGTTITLHLDAESEEFLDETRLRTILTKYCAFLPVPIYLNGAKINKESPLWLKSPSACTKQEYLQFYHTLYPFEPDPIFWIHLNVDYPFHLQGILYFPKVGQSFNFQDKPLRLFCNRVFVSDNCKDLLPDYLTVLRGAIDSPDIPLNVSRSFLQMDRTVRTLAQHIAKRVCDRLEALYTTEREHFLDIWPDLEPIIKLGILQDDKFAERAKPFLVWKTAKGAWVTLDDYLERHKEGYNGKVYYTSAHQEQQSPILALYVEKNIEVLQASTLLDTPLFNALEQKYPGVTFQRIDGALDPHLLDPTREKSLLDAEGKSEAAKIAEFIRTQLQPIEVEVEAKSLASNDLPAIIAIDENTRRLKETLQLTQRTASSDLPTKQTFIVNTNHKLVQSLLSLKESKPPLAKDLVHHLYELSLLSQKELPPSQLADFSHRAHRLLEQVTETILSGVPKSS